MYSVFCKGFSCRLKAHRSFLSHSPRNVNLFRTPKLSQNFSSKSKNYYDILKITPKATQNEIKTAYFKLSKLYHPDVNKDDADSARRFLEVTEAYEMLSNDQFRKKYDTEGFNVDRISNYEEILKSTSAKKPKVYTGRSTAYNYDEWMKGHYSELFRRRNEVKTTQREFERRLNEHRERKHRSVYLTTVITFVMLTFLSMVYALEKQANLNHGPQIVTKKGKPEENNH